MVEYTIQCRVQPKPSNVDIENRIIRDVYVAEEGLAKGWGITIDGVFLRQFAEDINKNPKGLKVNFDHNASNMGKQVGRIINARVVGKALKADFKIYKAADMLPGMAGTGTWILNQAKEDNEAIMFSIRAKLSRLFQLSDGEEVPAYMPEPGVIEADPSLGPVYARLQEAKSADLVEDGALTEVMFSKANIAKQFQMLENHPQLDQYLEANYQDLSKITKFFSEKITASADGDSWMTKAKRFFTGQDAELQAAKKKITQLEKELAMSKENNDDKTQEELQARLAELDKERTELKEQLEAKEGTEDENKKLEAQIKELKAASKKAQDDLAAFKEEHEEALKELHAGGDTPPGGGDNSDEDIPLYLSDPTTQKAQAMYEARKKTQKQPAAN